MPPTSSLYFFIPFPNEKFWTLPNWRSLQTTILNLMKMAGRSPKGWKTLGEMEKLLVTSNFSLTYSVFKRLVLRTSKNQGLFGKGLNLIVTYTSFWRYNHLLLWYNAHFKKKISCFVNAWIVMITITLSTKKREQEYTGSTISVCQSVCSGILFPCSDLETVWPRNRKLYTSFDLGPWRCHIDFGWH